MRRFIAAWMLATGCSLLTSNAQAQNAPAAQKKVASSKKSSEPAHDDDRAPDVSGSSALEYDCELGNKLTLYRNPGDAQHVALRWQKKLLRLRRVETTTGASRFENKKNGWVWIDIPAKGMLLDSKKGRQLANECKHPEAANTNVLISS